jgi:hypothetical protein
LKIDSLMGQIGMVQYSMVHKGIKY